MNAETGPSTRLTLHRDLGTFGDTLRRIWANRWAKVAAVIVALPILGYIALWLIFAQGLPSADSLLTYQPPLPTNVRGINGETVQTFARERRVELNYDEFPPQLVHAFISAEDRTFFEHGGIDYPGLIGAVFDYISKMGSGERAKGGSTITQQVAKNLLLSNEYSVTRKIKEAFLARRIEHVLTKQQILELYLNQIFLGRNAYGVQAAARAYFDKDVDQLTLPEMAYLAVLPKAPNNYDPVEHPERAIARRNYVLNEMEKNGYITPAERDAASAAPLGTVRGPSNSVHNVGGYFMEEVRRLLVDRYGKETEKGPNGVYTGGLWVRTSYNPAMQKAAENALRNGLMRYADSKGWNDPGLSVDMSKDWRSQLATARFGVGYDDWRAAVVLSKEGDSAKIGFTDGSTGTLPAGKASMRKAGTQTPAFEFLRPGMIIAVEQDGSDYALRSIPKVSGGMVVEDVSSGRIMAMQGGWDVRGSSFNRATQALRQPGSTFKPFVYATALDNGMTPATIILDAPFCVWQGAGLGQKCFRNFGNQSAGPQTLRWAVEQSRNLMTVRTANQIGMDKIVRFAKKMGIGDFPPYLSIALGAGDTTVMRMANGIATFANGGKALKPTLIDYIQDRNGKVIWRADTRPCDGCNAPDWNGKPMPRPPLRTKQLVDPLTAYQIVHIMEGVVKRGTAHRLNDLGRPMFGKTGTTTGPTNVWFVGGTPEVVAAIYVGYDQPKPMGYYAQGGTVAVPIFKEFAQKTLMDRPIVPFRQPPGIRMVRIDRRSGRKVFGEWPSDDPKAAVIWEAFKPESEPRRTIRREEIARTETPPGARRTIKRTTDQAQPSDFLQREGGIY